VTEYIFNLQYRIWIKHRAAYKLAIRQDSMRTFIDSDFRAGACDFSYNHIGFSTPLLF